MGALPLVHAEPKVQDEVIIIQHPGGGQKQIALSHNVVAYVDAKRLQYLTDTLEGSSARRSLMVSGRWWRCITKGAGCASPAPSGPCIATRACTSTW